MSTETNGKTTAGLVMQIATILGAIATPLILMFARLNTLETQLNERMTEVETQFRAEDELRNVQYASSLRTQALLWQKSYGEEFPSEVYFPTISKERK